MTQPLDGQTCIVTGATSGLGRACAEQLAGLGARLELVCRNRDKAERARDEISSTTGNPQVDFVIADLESQAATRAAASTLLERCDRIDLLLNNAGVTNLSREATIDGIETTFAVNHLAYFLLTNLLLERITSTASARIVSVASDAHKFGGEIDMNDLELEQGYRWTRAYGRSKGANILWTRELARRLESSGVSVHCVHPGFVRSNLGGNNGGFGQAVVKLAGIFAMSADKAARYIVDVCTGSEYGDSSGGYFYKARAHEGARWTRNDELAAQLWERSEQYVNAQSPMQEQTHE